jgi:hypothetical protein
MSPGQNACIGGKVMDKRELAYARQTIPMVREWDDFQSVIRTWAKMIRFRSGGESRPVFKKSI